MNTLASTSSTPTNLSPSKSKDLSNLLGLNDLGPGTPSREVAQMVALQSLPNVAPEINALSPSKKNLNKFLGIGQPKRARPQSLEVDSTNSARLLKLNQLKALNKTLSRLTSATNMAAQSAPATPDNYPCSLLHCDENLSPLKKKNLHKYLGLPPPPPPIPPPRTASSSKKRAEQDPPSSILKMTSTLSSSTPEDLEKENAGVDALRRISQSNDGLATPSSCTTPFRKGIPAMTPPPHAFSGTEVAVVGPMQSNSMFSLATASNSLPRPHVQPSKPPVAEMRPNLSYSLQRGATMISGQPLINNSQRLPPQRSPGVTHTRTLPRSITLALGDIEEPMSATNWVQRPTTTSGINRHSSLQHRSILKDNQNNCSAARRSHSSANAAQFIPGLASHWPPSKPTPSSCCCGTEAQQQMRVREPIYVTMGQNHHHHNGMSSVPPTVLTLNPPPNNKATTTVMVNSDNYLNMNTAKVKTTAIVHNEPTMFCNSATNQKTVVQICGEVLGAVSRVESELEETI